MSSCANSVELCLNLFKELHKEYKKTSQIPFKIRLDFSL